MAAISTGIDLQKRRPTLPSGLDCPNYSKLQFFGNLEYQLITLEKPEDSALGISLRLASEYSGSDLRRSFSPSAFKTSVQAVPDAPVVRTKRRNSAAEKPKCPEFSQKQKQSIFRAEIVISWRPSKEGSVERSIGISGMRQPQGDRTSRIGQFVSCPRKTPKTP